MDDKITGGEAGTLREKIDEFLDRAYQIGGAFRTEYAPIALELRKSLMDSTREAFKDNPVVLKSLNKAENFYYLNIHKFYSDFWAQVGRDDSPIRPDESIPSMLSETPKELSIAWAFIRETNPSMVPSLRLAMKRLILKVQFQGGNIQQWEEKKAILGIE